METATKKRPLGVAVLAILWLLFGVYTIYASVQPILGDIDTLNNMAHYGYSGSWLNLGIPVELCLYIGVLFLGVVQIVSAVGLLKGSKSLYRLALVVLVAFVLVNLGAVILYYTGQAAFVILTNLFTVALLTFFLQIILAGIYWTYLKKTHVMAYFGIEPKPQPTPFTVQWQPYVPPTPVTGVEPNQSIYCRYCGFKNNVDAVYCETCGAKLKREF
jgi:hypothetical protein